MKYNFDEVVDRSNTNSMKMSGFRDYLFKDYPNVKFKCNDDDLVKMWIADMEFATPQVILDAIKARVDKKIFGYSQIFDDDYYNSFAKWCQRRYGWQCEKEHLVTSLGIIPALYEIIDLMIKPEEKILTCTPAYGFFKYAAEFNKRELVCSALIKKDNKMSIDFDDLTLKAQDPKTKLLLFCNPHNPNGIVWTQEELLKVEQIARENDLWIISDEIHCDLLRSNLKHVPLAKLCPTNDRIVTCMAPSKTFNLAGLMLSNIIIPNQELLAAYKEHHFTFENPLSVTAVQAAYESGEEWLIELQAYLDINFKYLDDFLNEKLDKAIFSIPAATYLAWIDLSAYFDNDLDLALFFAQEAGVLLEAGNQFVQDGDGFIRLNLACPKAMLVDALNKIEDAIKNK